MEVKCVQKEAKTNNFTYNIDEHGKLSVTNTSHRYFYDSIWGLDKKLVNELITGLTEIKDYLI